jgi:hypothetical protein
MTLVGGHRPQQRAEARSGLGVIDHQQHSVLGQPSHCLKRASLGAVPGPLAPPPLSCQSGAQLYRQPRLSYASGSSQQAYPTRPFLLFAPRYEVSQLIHPADESDDSPARI